MVCLTALLLLTLFAGPARAAGESGLSAWIADWDMERGLREWRAHPGLFGSVRVFSAAFTERGGVELAPAWASLLGRDVTTVFGRVPVLLTVVNDVVSASGKNNKLKDPGIVAQNVATAEARSRHIAALLALAERSRFTGLEIDYENVAEDVWPQFLTFIRELWAKTQERGLTLAVVLQPQRRYLTMPLPSGPSYVLMGYNLFGSHSGPGPKATPAFLADQAASLRAIGALDATALALATGGFDWIGDKSVNQLDETAAADLIAAQKASSRRSEPDGYLVSRYRDAAGHNHEIWHADAVTFSRLWQSARASGFRSLIVWRLGGNSPALFSWLATLHP